jgi:hypothetical protein
VRRRGGLSGPAADPLPLVLLPVFGRERRHSHEPDPDVRVARLVGERQLELHQVAALDRRPEGAAFVSDPRTLQLIGTHPLPGAILVSEEPHLDGTHVRERGACLRVGDVGALEAEPRFRVHEVRHGETEAGEVEVVAVPGPCADRNQAVG